MSPAPVLAAGAGSAPALTALVHLVGFGAGVALYAMIGVLALRTAPAGSTGPSPRATGDALPLATAALGVCWSAGALVLYPLRDLGLFPDGRGPWWLAAVGALAFAALGALPAVAVAAAAQPLGTRARRGFTRAAVALSAGAAAWHAWEAAARGAAPARPALVALTAGYAALVGVLAVRLRGQPAARGPLVAAAVAAFAVAGLHLRHHGPQESPAAHLLGDHASLLLALVILAQDYRFAFADLVFKRALGGLAAVATAVGAAALAARAGVPDAGEPVRTAAFVGALAAALTLAPRAWRGVDRVVDRVLLRRADYGAVRGALAAAVGAAPTPDAALDAAVTGLTPAFGAGALRWSTRPAPAAGVHVTARGQTAAVPVPTTDAPGYTLHVDHLGGGRRLLSDDLALLEWAALQAARRVDALRAAQERFAREAREHEAVRLAAEAELRALRAQLNPHFLFNALTTVGYLVQTAPDRALATLYELTGLLRAVLRSPDGQLVSFGEELAIVEAYLAIEGARFEERLRVTVDADAAARAVRVPPLLVQPLVENAVKHGVAPLRRGAAVRVWARVEPGPDGGRLRVRVSDDGAGADPDALPARRAAGLGLSSVERRLTHTYGARAAFAFEARPGAGATAELVLPADAGADAMAGTAA